MNLVFTIAHAMDGNFWLDFDMTINTIFAAFIMSAAPLVNAEIFVSYATTTSTCYMNCSASLNLSTQTVGILGGERLGDGSTSYHQNRILDTLQANTTLYVTHGHIEGDAYLGIDGKKSTFTATTGNLDISGGITIGNDNKKSTFPAVAGGLILSSGIFVNSAYGNAQEWTWLSGGVKDIQLKLSADASNTDFGFTEGNDFRFFAAGRYLLRLGQGSEGVIVGLTTDSSAIDEILTVQGNETPLISIGLQNVDTGADSKAYIQTKMRDTGATDRTAGRIGFQKQGTWTAANDINSAYVIENTTANSVTERFRITADGRVGFSTAAPVAAFTMFTSSGGNGFYPPTFSQAELRTSTPMVRGLKVTGNYGNFDWYTGTATTQGSWRNDVTGAGP